MFQRRDLILAGFATVLGRKVQAQSTFPTRPIRILLATGVGSGPDLAVRSLTGSLSELLKQPIVVENKPGANGIIAAKELLKAPRDGYTLLNANIGNALNDILRPLAGPKMFDDLLPLTDLTAGPMILLVNSSLPVYSAGDLLAYGKSHPNELNYGSGGPGSLIQLIGERLKLATGLPMKEVPYRSFGADLIDLVAGHVQVGFTVWSLIEGQIRAGKVRPLAIASEKRITQMPDLPTFAEAGLTDIVATGWNGMFAPAGTPNDIVETLSRALTACVKRPEYVQKFTSDGSEVGGKSPEEFAAYIRREQARYREVIVKANIKVLE